MKKPAIRRRTKRLPVLTRAQRIASAEGIATDEKIAKYSSPALGLSVAASTLRKLMANPKVSKRTAEQEALLLLQADIVEHLASLVFGVVEKAGVILQGKNAESAIAVSKNMSALGTKSQRVQAPAREARKADLESKVSALLDALRDKYGVPRKPDGTRMTKDDAYYVLKEQLPDAGENKLRPLISRLWLRKPKNIYPKK